MPREQHAFSPSASRPRLFAALTAAVLAGVLSGCPPTSARACDTDAECPDGRCRFGACGPICEEDPDCGSRQICQSGACVPAPECAQDRDCAEGFSCASGQCQCQGDAACALNQSCVGGRCQTRERCEADGACPLGQRCEVTQGLCLPPCTFAPDCAPGLDPRVSTALYSCQQGNCYRHCIGDASCGTGLICADGLCTAAQCDTMTDCPQGQYCTSALFGRCAGFQECSSSAQCQPNFSCRRFDPQQCPPGFPCDRAICLELQRCLVDPDCQSDLPGQPSGTRAYCAEGHCQPTRPCTLPSQCAADQACVGGLCVPGACRGQDDCPGSEACVAGACRLPPKPADIAQLELSPAFTTLEVGETAQLHLIGYELDGSSFPLASASFEALDSSGSPSIALSTEASGKVTGVTPGLVTVRAQVPGSAVLPITAQVEVHARVAQGRRVVVVSQSTGRAIAGVVVRGCDGPTTAGPCPSPIEVQTDAAGEAAFPGFASAQASFSAASPELRADGLPRYERVSVLDTRAADLLLPLSENPVEAASGFNAVLSFNQVHSDGNYWLGFTVLSAGDPAEVTLQQLLGEPFQISLPGIPQKLPVPGSVVLYTSPGLGIPNEVKGRSLGLGQSGRRTATAFAGRTTTEQLGTARSTDFLAWAGGFDFALLPFNAIVPRPFVPDTTDVDGDGLCTLPQQCPLGPEQVPDYFNFARPSLGPDAPQALRTEVVLPELPAEYDTAIVAVVSLEDEAGLTPLGFTSRTAGAPTPGGGRPLDPVVMRSGAPRAGVEAGRPGIWLMGVQAASTVNGGGSFGGRLLTRRTLPTRAAMAPLLPSAANSAWSPQGRIFSPGQPEWNAVVSAGGALARVDVTGSKNRHRIYFAAEGSQTQVVVPSSPVAGGPAAGGSDPLDEPGSKLSVTVLQLAPGSDADDALDLPGASLERPASMIEGYSRWQAP